LDVLATLIDAYEHEHYPMDSPDPIEAIKFRTEQQSLTRKDLEGMIRRLHEKLGISADVLIRPSKIKLARAKRAA
jgi:HTH-type transcriptional regulator/antitoxin HigA